MAFTVRDLQDLIVLLEEHPEWRAQMRRLVLTDDVLALPSIVEEIAAEVRALAEAQRRTEERLEALAEAQRRTEERMGELAAAIHTLVETQKRTEETLRRMGNDLGKSKGDALERRYRERAPYLFARVLRRPRLVPLEELDDRLAEAVERGVLTEEDLLDVLAADAVVRGFHASRTGSSTWWRRSPGSWIPTTSVGPFAGQRIWKRPDTLLFPWWPGSPSVRARSEWCGN